MYKYVSIVLAGALVVLGVMYLWQQHKFANRETELSNQVAKLEGTVQETESAYSVRGYLIDELKTKNYQLQGAIDKRDEEIAALGQAVLKWKGEYFKIKDAKETVVDSGENPVEHPENLPDDQRRIRVDFQQAKNYTRVYGFTLTNPAYAEVSIEQTRGLKLNFILTKKGKDFKLYFDTNSPDLIVSDLVLKVDPSVFERSWYENIGLAGTVFGGGGMGASVALVYDFNKLIIGPSIGINMNDDTVKRFYGVTFVMFPARYR